MSRSLRTRSFMTKEAWEMSREQEEYKRRQERLLDEHIKQVNSRIQPETPGCVRTTGSRRQYRASRGPDGGLVLTEI